MFSDTVAQGEKELCVGFRDASTFKLRWMVKGLEKKLKAEAAAYKGESAAGADVVNEILEMVKEPLDRLLKDFTEVEKWRRQAESFRSALSDDNREQTRQLVHLIRKETEARIAQERGEVEKQMLEQRQGIEMNALRTTSQTETGWQSRIVNLRSELVRIEELRVESESQLIAARAIAVQSNKVQKDVRESYRNSIGELECEMAEIAVRTTKAIETARQLNKEVKKRETAAEAMEKENKAQWQTTAKKRVGRGGSKSFGGKPGGSRRRAAMVLVDETEQTNPNQDLEDEEEARKYDAKVLNLMTQLDVKRDRAVIFLGQNDGHAGKAIQMYRPTLPRDDPDGLQELFNEIDEDGSGTLDQEEIANMCKTLGRELTARELEVAMTNMDADGSCEVDIDEFKDWWAAMKKKGQVPSWANAIADKHRAMKEAREKRRGARGSLMRNASEDQKSAMAMRAR